MTSVGLMNVGPSSAPEKTVEFMAPPPPPAPSAPPQSVSIALSGTLSPSIKNTKFLVCRTSSGPALLVTRSKVEKKRKI